MRYLGYSLAVLAVVATLGLAQDDVTTENYSKIVKPKIQPVYLKEGDRMQLTCEVYQGDTVIWEKAGDVIDSSTHTGIVIWTRIENQHYTSTLEKAAVSVDDGDNYACYPDNQKQHGYNVMVNVFQIIGHDVEVEKYFVSYSLRCEVDIDSHEPMRWYHKGVEVFDDADKYLINASNNTLTINELVPADIGTYTCAISLSNGQTYNQTVEVKSRPNIKQFDHSKNLVEGDPLVLECEAAGNPEPVISWLKDHEAIDTSDPRLSFSAKNGIANATLRLEELQFEDRAEYTCVAVNFLGNATSTILVRVKDKLAALWPFLGICAEVAILVIIIFIYEHRRSKKLEELDAREEADHLTNSHAHKGGDEVRQRK